MTDENTPTLHVTVNVHQHQGARPDAEVRTGYVVLDVDSNDIGAATVFFHDQHALQVTIRTLQDAHTAWDTAAKNERTTA